MALDYSIQRKYQKKQKYYYVKKRLYLSKNYKFDIAFLNDCGIQIF